MDNITEGNRMEEWEIVFNKSFPKINNVQKHDADNLKDGFMEGFKAASNLSKQVGGWVKASERLPNIIREAAWRYSQTKIGADPYNILGIVNKELTEHYDKIEWWDESTSPSCTDWTLITSDLKSLPPENTVVLGYSPEWVDEDFEPEGVRECFVQNDNEWNSAKWNNDQDTWENEESKPTHWMQRPQPPKNIIYDKE